MEGVEDISEHVHGQRHSVELEELSRISRRDFSDGAEVMPQVIARPVCTLFRVVSEKPFQYFPIFQPLKNLPLAERVTTMRNPQLLSKDDPNTTGMSLIYNLDIMWERTYPMGDPLKCTPDQNNSIAAVVRREHRTRREVAADLMLEQDGGAFLMYAAAGYTDANERGAVFEDPASADGARWQ
jgi:hypothetical protein